MMPAYSRRFVKPYTHPRVCAAASQCQSISSHLISLPLPPHRHVCALLSISTNQSIPSPHPPHHHITVIIKAEVALQSKRLRRPPSTKALAHMCRNLFLEVREERANTRHMLLC